MAEELPEEMDLNGAQTWATEGEAQAFADGHNAEAPAFMRWHVVPAGDAFAVVMVSGGPPAPGE